MLSNLLANSLKFTGNGGRITVAVHERTPNFVFSVTDDGAGIESEDLPRIFDRYWQAGGRERKGLGLGLAVAKGNGRGARRSHLGREPIGQGSDVLVHAAHASARTFVSGVLEVVDGERLDPLGHLESKNA